MTSNKIIVRWLGQQAYHQSWEAMRQFTDMRTEDTADEVWLLEHLPVFTQGQSGKAEHLLNPGDIPIVQSDRGGQITYHGPGQLMVYTLVDLRRKKINIREFVSVLEQSIVDLLADYGIPAHAKPKAPGVYVEEKKIASIGLRVRKGCSFHGIAFNVGMDLGPFTRINPCGFAGLKMTQLSEFCGPRAVMEVGKELVKYLMRHLSYNEVDFCEAKRWK